MKGQTFGPMLGHAIRRAVILIFLGIFLRSLRSHQTYFTFEDTMTQIGLGYVFLFLLGFTRVRTQVVTLVLILICFWAAFALYPAPGPQFDYARVGVPRTGITSTPDFSLIGTRIPIFRGRSMSGS